MVMNCLSRLHSILGTLSSVASLIDTCKRFHLHIPHYAPTPTCLMTMLRSYPCVIPKNILRPFITSADLRTQVTAYLYRPSLPNNKQVKEIKAAVSLPQRGNNNTRLPHRVTSSVPKLCEASANSRRMSRRWSLADLRIRP